MAFIKLKRIQFSIAFFAILPVALVLSNTSLAQEPDMTLMNKVLKQYKNENAVFISYKKKLEIKYEEGELTANSFTETERLLTGDLSPAYDHYDHVYDDYFDRLTQLDAIAFVPQPDGQYKRIKKFHTFDLGAGGGDISEAVQTNTTFTGLTKGSVIRLTATQSHPDITALPFFDAGEDYPILHAEFEVVAPEFVNLKFVLKGNNTSIIKESKEEKNGNIIYKFTADNLPGHKHFGSVPSYLYYMPHVITMITSFRLPGEKKDSLLLSDPEHLYKSQYKYVGNLNVKQDTTLKKLVDEIIKGDKTDRQKAEHLYAWVQKNMHYIGIEIGIGGWLPREADTVCKRKYGDCKDMASLLQQMGRMAGLQTYFTWIGTTEKPYTFEETPMPMVSNHMICALKLNNEWLFMDGTDPNLPFGANREDIQGKEAMIAIDKNTFKIVTIPVVQADKNVTIDSSHVHISPTNDADLVGTVKEKFTGYMAWDLGFLLSYYTKEKDEREKTIRALTMRGSNKFVLDKYNIGISDTGNRNISLTGDFTIGGYVNKSGKDYIVNLNLLHHLKENYIDTADRDVPWFNRYKQLEKEVVVFEIPTGYKVTYLPKNASGKFNDDWNYSIAYKIEGNNIILTKEYRFNTLSIGKQSFIENNRAIAALNKQYQESVVLTEKNKK